MMYLSRIWLSFNTKDINKAWAILGPYWRNAVPKMTVDIPQHIIDDVNAHVGDGKKFISFSDAVRSALRKMLDQLDEIDRRKGRLEDE
jgi:hypothetical protein